MTITAGTIRQLETELAYVRQQMRAMPEATRQQFVAAQQRADKVYRAFDSSAPQWLNGETLHQYRRRLLEPHQTHSQKWKTTDLAKIGPALDVAEDQIYADAYRSACEPTNDGKQRCVTEPDQAGRMIRRFYGDPRAFVDQFRANVPLDRRGARP